MRKKEDLNMTEDDFRVLQQTAEDDLDRELNDLIIRNQKNITELHNDVK